jgi:tRNA uridine 5-carboxymethylaminomethyl modification enzyme
MYDVLVIGAGHAGVEAAAAAARRGARVALATFSRDDIGRMSCNPSIGGVGKGHLVREVDALGGLMAHAGDAAAIHHRMLNASKGSAVRGPRVQADRRRFKAAVEKLLDDHDVGVLTVAIDALKVEHGHCLGAITADGQLIEARAVVLATGTFLGATLFRGSERWSGGASAAPRHRYLARNCANWGWPTGCSRPAPRRGSTVERLTGRAACPSQAIARRGICRFCRRPTGFPSLPAR